MHECPHCHYRFEDGESLRRHLEEGTGCPSLAHPAPPAEVGDVVTTACPTCGQVADRTAYDVGSGPELSCASCEWCWGANGQALEPLDLAAIATTRFFDNVRVHVHGQRGRSHVLDDDEEGPQ